MAIQPKEEKLEKLLYSVPSGARMLSISDRKMWEMLKSGAAIGKKIGRRTLLSRRELERLAK